MNKSLFLLFVCLFVFVFVVVWLLFGLFVLFPGIPFVGVWEFSFLILFPDKYIFDADISIKI